MLNDRQRRIKRRHLGNVAQDLSGFNGLIVYAVDGDLSLILQEADYRLDDRALAGAVWSQKDSKRSGIKCERNIITGNILTVTFSHVFYF